MLHTDPMDQQEILAHLSGAQQIVDWFGYWPSFHDSEILSIALSRVGASRVQIHAFAMTDQIDQRGYYTTDRHAIVTFLLEDITNLELGGFNNQNVISSLVLRKEATGYVFVLGGCYGIEGSITAGRIRVEMEPGMPQQSIYAENDINGSQQNG